MALGGDKGDVKVLGEIHGQLIEGEIFAPCLTDVVPSTGAQVELTCLQFGKLPTGTLFLILVFVFLARKLHFLHPQGRGRGV